MRGGGVGLFLAGSFWDLATPLALVLLVWRKGEAIIIGWGEKEKRKDFFVVLHCPERKPVLLELLYLR